MENSNNRLTFDLYLYDYFKRNNMHETAENFVREIKFPFDAARVFPAIDVQDGFLKEWWGIFYDVYKAQQQNAHDQGEGPSSTKPVEQMMGARQQVDPSPSNPHVMNEKAISRLLAGPGLNTGNNAMWSLNHLTGVEPIPKGISSSLHPQDWLKLTLALIPEYLANLAGQEGASVPAAPIEEEIASDKSGEKSVNKLDSEDRNCSLQGDAGPTSEASITKYKSCDDYAKSTSLNANVEKEVADFSFFSRLLECTRAPDSLIEAPLTKYKSCDDDAKLSSSNASVKNEDAKFSSSKLSGCAKAPEANVKKEDADFSSSKFPGCAKAPGNMIVNQVVKVKAEKEW